MKTIFLIDVSCFSIGNLGGTDSYMRRLISVLRKNNHDVQLILYKRGKSSNIKFNDKFSIKFHRFNDLYRHLDKIDSQVFICYLNPIDRLKFILRRIFAHKKNKKINLILFFYPNSFMKKIYRAFEIISSDYSNILCVSKRLLNFSKFFQKKSFFLPPIVPKNYTKFGLKKIELLKEGVNTIKNKALFLGRLDPRKGINEVIELVEFSDYFVWTISGIFFDKTYKSIYKGIRDNSENLISKLKNLKNITFEIENINSYNIEIESKVAYKMSTCSYFLQPYNDLSSTVDLPLLLLEAQACGCIVLTTFPNELERYITYPSASFKKFNVQKFHNYMIKTNSIDKNIQNLEEMVNNIKKNYSEEVILNKFMSIFKNDNNDKNN